MIRIIKLASGQELIGKIVEQTNNQVVMEDVIQINYKSTSAPMPAIAFSKYFPLSSDTQVSFPVEQITHVANPRESFIKYYHVLINGILKDLGSTMDEELDAVTKRDMILLKSQDVVNEEPEEALAAITTALLENMTSNTTMH